MGSLLDPPSCTHTLTQRHTLTRPLTRTRRYVQTKQYAAATSDFQRVLARIKECGAADRADHARLAVFATCQLGLILMLHQRNLVAASLQFTRAIALDPT